MKKWDCQFEGNLPDARTKSRKTIFLRGKEMEMVFCTNCGSPGGAISPDWAEHVFYICQSCFERFGAVGTEAPEDMIRNQNQNLSFL